MAFTNKIPDWKNEGVEPSEELKTNGFQHGYKPPAGIFNWFWSKVSKCIKEIQEKTIETNENGAVPIEKGGTGATTAEEALENLGALPKTGGAVSGQTLGVYNPNAECPQLFTGHDVNNRGVLSYYNDVLHIACVADGVQATLAIDNQGNIVMWTPEGEGKALYGEHNKPTASDVGALPLSGGTLSDEIVVSKNGTASVRVVNASTGRRGTFQVDGNTTYILNGNLDSSEYFGLSIDNTPTDLEEKLRFINKTAQDTRATIYTVFGTHNKNGGSYSGNGSATQRTKAVEGIGYHLVITSDIGTAWVSSRGAICLDRTTGEVSGLKSWECYFKDGVLTIATDSELVNKANQTYWYDVL